ncbi:hypothetical protein TNCV_4635861 [Trichonephila clavipes]|nr:hypothetical protein TNCV_4635861 [Trichonephila clavipes]
MPICFKKCNKLELYNKLQDCLFDSTVIIISLRNTGITHHRPHPILCVVPARISSQRSRHCWRLPLPHASTLIQRFFGCVLDVQQTKKLLQVAKVDLESEPTREAIQSGDRRITFGQCVPRVVAHYPVEIWLWPSPEGKSGQLAATPRRCSSGCLKYRQCVLEECEIQYRPNHYTQCRTRVAVHNAAIHYHLPTVSPDSNPTIVVLQTDA